MYNSIGHCCFMYLALFRVMYGESLVGFMFVETRRERRMKVGEVFFEDAFDIRLHLFSIFYLARTSAMRLTML